MPSEQTLKGLLFEGAPEILSLLTSLVSRPRWWRDLPLPLLYLARPLGSASPLKGIADWLAQENKKQFRFVHVSARTHATVSGDDAPRSLPNGADFNREKLLALHSILDRVVAGLAGPRKGSRRIRFPHYSVAGWLVGLYTNAKDATRADRSATRRNAELREFLRGHRPTVKPAADVIQLEAQVPWYIGLAAFFSLRIARLATLAWPVRGWFARHELAGGGGIADLASYFEARRPTVDQVCRLLVDAMLRDLLVAYRRTKIPGTRRGRLNYAVLLLDDVGIDTLGLALLELIDASRNEVVNRRLLPNLQYRRDPLLVVATGDDAALRELAHGREINTALLSPSELGHVHRAWLADIDRDGVRRWWVLPLRIPQAEPPPGIRTALTGRTAPRGRRSIAAPVALALVATAGIVGGWYSYGNCWTFDSHLSREVLVGGQMQCVGISDGKFRFFEDFNGPDGLDASLKDDLMSVEEHIVNANKRARRHADVVSVVYLGILTGGQAESYGAVLEELLGLAAAQQEASDLGRPMQVLLANAGDDMHYASLAADVIVRRAAHDRSIVAVVGMGISHTETRAAMLRIAQARIPMVGTVISATGLAADTTPFYHQVGPTNEREAAVLAFYVAGRLEAKSAEVYYSADSADLYSQDLKDQLRSKLEAVGVAVSDQRYRATSTGDGVEVGELGGRACALRVRRPKSVAIYAGRAERFDEFIAGMEAKCQGSFPALLAGDDVTRHLLARTSPLPNGLVVDYAALASSLAWGDCFASFSPPFFAAYLKILEAVRLSGSSDVCARTRDGGAMLAYDASRTVLQAVRDAGAGDGTPSPDAVLGQLQQFHGPAQLTGATGVINFLDDRRVPKDKVVVVLRAEGPDRPVRLFHCGRLGHAEKAPTEARGCPLDRSEV